MISFVAVSKDKGYSRDDADTGLKDLVFGLVTVLKDDTQRNSIIVLDMPQLGRLQICGGNKFKFM